jgi:5-formyltetrahydrofolate cyclo-ligase
VRSSARKPMSSETKAVLRRQLRGEVARHTATELAEASRAICERIVAHKQWREAQTVLLYAPLSGEPDVRSLIESALEAAKLVALPRYEQVAARYEACRVTDSKGLRTGQFGVLEPSAECPVCELNELDLALVPGIGFSLNGCRLGRGKGFFDRMLSEVRGWKCGVAFDWQVTVEIPTEPHDIRLNSIVTPSRWHVVPL